MKFLLDENLSPRLADVLKDLGHDAVHIQSLKLKEADNGVVFSKSVKQGRVLVTADEDFADTDAYPPGPGTIIVAFEPRTREQVAVRLNALLHQVKTKDVKRTVIILREEDWEFRRASR